MSKPKIMLAIFACTGALTGCEIRALLGSGPGETPGSFWLSYSRSLDVPDDTPAVFKDVSVVWHGERTAFEETSNSLVFNVPTDFPSINVAVGWYTAPETLVDKLAPGTWHLTSNVAVKDERPPTGDCQVELYSGEEIHVSFDVPKYGDGPVTCARYDYGATSNASD